MKTASGRAVGVLAAGAAVAAGLAVGPAAGGAQAADAAERWQGQVTITEPEGFASAYVDWWTEGIERHVTMMPAGDATQWWEFHDSPAGGTTIRHVDTGACMRPDPDSAERFVEIGDCVGEPQESWTVTEDTGEGAGVVFVHQPTGDCLTRAAPGTDIRLTLTTCDDGELQRFRIP